MMFMIDCKKFDMSALNYFAYTFVRLYLPILWWLAKSEDI